MVCAPLALQLVYNKYCYIWVLQYHGKAISKSLCLWPLENRSMALKGGRGPQLRNPGLVDVALAQLYTPHQ